MDETSSHNWNNRRTTSSVNTDFNSLWNAADDEDSAIAAGRAGLEGDDDTDTLELDDVRPRATGLIAAGGAVLMVGGETIDPLAG